MRGKKKTSYMHTQKNQNPYSFIVEKKSTRMWRPGSKEIRIVVEYKSTKKIFLLYHIINPERF